MSKNKFYIQTATLAPNIKLLIIQQLPSQPQLPTISKQYNSGLPTIISP